MSRDYRDQLRALAKGNPPAEDAGIFGASLSPKHAQIVIIPVPFEATTSYGGGTSKAPKQIEGVSHQLDLYDRFYENPFLAGIAYLDEGQEFVAINREAKDIAQKVIHDWESGVMPKQDDLDRVNNMSASVNGLVYRKASQLLENDQVPVVLGGDHSVPLGLIKALGEHHGDFGVLHIDAHHDLRVAYEGFQYSHASIMYNVLEEVPQVSKIKSIGIRDFSLDEKTMASQSSRVDTLYDSDLQEQRFKGASFHHIIDEFLKDLPSRVYVSFDIDGLDPSCCPHTGTPVPGGLSFAEASYILELLVESKREVIGFDLSEVSPGEDEWDANVGSRILYKLCGAVAKSLRLKPLVDID
ncbi:agmatinase family protein [Pseudobacteriovorax antillogorgiicola]|uniref:Agmatinase n=1 Tax=Pseudobacteriovorax antillogorgiicola TaxID=1513793 RepID=A0A1Y6BXG9_9BACT|nr:agmatinase family protein [Pseudobacteriovorax antillogorgiicola]TCS50306.1 agmatinase [Pseudobacteriovorax antillogorgiicola]SMF34035.1 agmatinase [Pseudobacteriovorax antillogorgiicola]